MKAPLDSVDGFDSHMVHPPGFGYCFPGGNVSIESREQPYHSYSMSLLSPPIQSKRKIPAGWGTNAKSNMFASKACFKGCDTLIGMNKPCSDVMGANPMNGIPASTTPNVINTTTEACRQKGQDFSTINLSYSCPYYSHGEHETLALNIQQKGIRHQWGVKAPFTLI